MRILFAGTPDFAAVALKAIADEGHDIRLVLTQPDRPAGRGMVLQPSAVKKTATELGIEVFQPPTLKDETAQRKLREESCEAMVVAAYGLILPAAVLDIPRFGCLNIHASLLPRWRGAAPIQRAILAGDRETGVCIMQMEAGLDTGPVIDRATTIIGAEDTAATLHDRLAGLGAGLVADVLKRLPLPAEPQPDVGITYAAKIEKREAEIDWNQSSASIDRQIRAFNPTPGAQTAWRGNPIKIWRAKPDGERGVPGTVLRADKDGVVVACGEGALRIVELQKAGGKRMPAAQFLAGTPLSAGEVLGPRGV